MSSPIVQVVLFLFTLFSFSKSNIRVNCFLVQFRKENYSKTAHQEKQLIPNIITADTPNFIEICNDDNVKLDIDPDLCFKILKSQEKIVPSTNQIDFAIAVIESGISNGTDTRTYIENVLIKKRNLDPDLKFVLQECNSSYVSAIGSLRGGRGEVKVGDYQSASYDLLIASSNNIYRCKNAVALKNIKDATILLGNKVLRFFGITGYNVANDLDRQCRW
ncbi:hypothetical protein ACS0TY_009391 [Phlomoides rotata]